MRPWVYFLIEKKNGSFFSLLSYLWASEWEFINKLPIIGYPSIFRIFLTPSQLYSISAFL